MNFSLSKCHYNIGNYENSRSAYACERYKELTGKNAPVITGQRQANYDDDLNARKIIAKELGNQRSFTLNSHIGIS